VLAICVLEERYRIRGIMKLELDPKIKEVQFMTKINHP